MWLQYAVNDNGELIYIEQTPRGRTDLHCPYCGGLLTAKKGQIKAPHFAHSGETCRQVERDQAVVALPAYDNFNLYLPPKVLQQLRDFAAGKDSRHYSYKTLEAHDLITLNEFNRAELGGVWELTKKGKLIVGQLSLMLFNDIQEPLLLARHNELEERAAEAHAKPAYEAQLLAIDAEAQPLLQVRTSEGHNRLVELNSQLWATRAKLEAIKIDYETAITDLRIYWAQWRRILSLTLYFLEINGGELHKIGVTTRPIDERIAEIAVDLRPHVGSVKIDVIGTWAHRGNVELYFKHRYHPYNRVMGDLTEYYQLEDGKAVIRDLRRMKAKELSELERVVLAGQPSALEERIRLEAVEQKRRIAIRRGMEKAARRGQHVGRPVQAEDAFLIKYAAVREALDGGLSLRQVAARTGVAINTVRKVQKLLE